MMERKRKGTVSNRELVSYCEPALRTHKRIIMQFSIRIITIVDFAKTLTTNSKRKPTTNLSQALP